MKDALWNETTPEPDTERFAEAGELLQTFSELKVQWRGGRLADDLLLTAMSCGFLLARGFHRTDASLHAVNTFVQT